MKKELLQKAIDYANGLKTGEELLAISDFYVSDNNVSAVNMVYDRAPTRTNRMFGFFAALELAHHEPAVNNPMNLRKVKTRISGGLFHEWVVIDGATYGIVESEDGVVFLERMENIKFIS